MEISKLVLKLENELSARSEALDAREEALNQRSAELASQAEALEAEVSRVDALNADIAPQLERVAKIEKKLKTEQFVMEERRSAEVSKKQAEKFNIEAKGHLDDARLKLEELGRRELALSEREKTYKAEVEKEIMQKFLRG